MEHINTIIHGLFILILGWYLITNLQWYSYKLERVIFKHHKRNWHYAYFVAPVAIYYVLTAINPMFFSAFVFAYLAAFVMWYKKLDKKLVITARIKRFLGILVFITASLSLLCSVSESCASIGVFIPLILTYAISFSLEKMFFLSYKHKAKIKIKSKENLTVVAITASFGKTSIKNFLYQVLESKYNVYKTPRSVNTLGGLVKDVNEDLPENIDIYIAEAGARQRGDIEEIAMFLEPQYTIVGCIGEQHIEYFKTIENIIYTKMELLKSPRLKKGIVHESTHIKDYDTIIKFPNNLEVLSNDLNGISFNIDIDGETHNFNAPILGSFNAINLVSVILMAKELGMSIDEIKLAISKLSQVEHRLQKIEAGGKVIIDDSFNGNLEGMLEGVNIASTYEGRKVIITPGIVESTDEANAQLAKEINRVFDYVVITGSLNQKVLKDNIDESKVEILEDKSKIETLLAQKTKAGDLILFANDAPNFI